ncbi:MAG TPA: hypothetical protein VLX58_18650 [Bryobacteraceae bacterium]|nr:hypothetical protein [Candidatus Acidoferrales bacterium]HUJ23564.1 hypothetical protein [Bryobacteraceae bacterium]
MKNVFRTIATGVGIAALFTASSLNAASVRSENISIPFAFNVSKVALPAGEYRIDKTYGTDLTFLTNLKTGQRVQVLGNAAARVEGRVKLVFEHTGGSYKLKTVS